MQRIENQINLEHTLNSGQVFLWEKTSRFWYGIDGQNVIRLSQQQPFEVFSFAATAATTAAATTTIQKEGNNKKNQYYFFREDDDFESIKKKLSRDQTVGKAIKEFPGLRIMRQDPFQCMITFIVSSNSNILRIRKNLYELCKVFGSKVEVDGKSFSLFPRPSQIAGASLQDLLRCGMGYRAKHVKAASEMVSSGLIDLEKIKSLDYYSAREEITRVGGVGSKVADCIMLFSLEKTEAFPLDTWMLKVLRKYYSREFDIISSAKAITEKQYEKAHDKLVDYFGNYCGYAQQFLFKMERDLNKKNWN